MKKPAVLEPSAPNMCLVVAFDGCGLLSAYFRIYNGLRQKRLEALVLPHNNTLSFGI